MVVREWRWSREGVTIEGDDERSLHLLWYEDLGPVAFASGGAVEQTFAHFLANGPWVERVPDDVVAEVTAAVRELVGQVPPQG